MNLQNSNFTVTKLTNLLKSHFLLKGLDYLNLWTSSSKTNSSQMRFSPQQNFANIFCPAKIILKHESSISLCTFDNPILREGFSKTIYDQTDQLFMNESQGNVYKQSIHSKQIWKTEKIHKKLLWFLNEMWWMFRGSWVCWSFVGIVDFHLLFKTVVRFIKNSSRVLLGIFYIWLGWIKVKKIVKFVFQWSLKSLIVEMAVNFEFFFVIQISYVNWDPDYFHW